MRDWTRREAIGQMSDRGVREERRQRRGASGAPIVEKRTERGQGALLGLDTAPRGSQKPLTDTTTGQSLSLIIERL